jgi:hypothetical protein
MIVTLVLLCAASAATKAHAADVRSMRSEAAATARSNASSAVNMSDTSTNWAGYEVLTRDNRRQRFTWVEGSWTVLGVHDVFSDDGHHITSGMSTWVGLGGCNF